ncbi:cytochrome c1 [Pelagibacterium montanilacus]|uniref:cytochrome c1 n=1 Tax=Pelagibacterium montanilacus TaxID=2185280 RepID=UPI000F8F3632|nr:cytochrome c1 [Pelagibacterium montanilacus]
MTKKKTLLGAVIAAVALAFAPMPAHSAGDGTHAYQQDWSFSGVFGTYDRNQLRRGFQVFREACSSCHGLDFISFRNLSEPGGPEYSEDAVRALAAEFTIADETAQGGERERIPADRWPEPFESEQIARDANGGQLPPDLSLMAKARGIHQDFPYWAFNYFTAYQEGGADYIYNLLTRYSEPPEGEEVPAGLYYNDFYGTIAMPPPLSDGLIAYEGEGTPQTVSQYSADVAAFLQWTADPHMVSRKQMGFRVMIFLVLFAGLLYLVKRKIWRDAH